LLSVGQNLSRIVGVGKRLAHITRHDRGIVEEVQETTAVFGKDDLLLGSFDGGGEVDVVCLLDLLTGLSKRQ
jgi:hypothetical protein